MSGPAGGFAYSVDEWSALEGERETDRKLLFAIRLNWLLGED